MTDDEQTQAPPGDEPEPVEPEPVEPEPVEPEPVEPEPVEPEQPAEPADAAPTARQLKAIERAHTTHENKLREIMGDAFDLFKACPTCEGAAIVPAELAAAEELAELPGAVVCVACHGYGQMRTPSRVRGQELQACVECAGIGWKRESAPPAAAAGYSQTPAPIVPNGNPAVPPGYILVQVDPNAPPLPPGVLPQPASAPAQV